MKILFSLCYLSAYERYKRNVQWLDYYKNLKDKLGYDKILFLDNASNMEQVLSLGGTVYDEHKKLIHEAPESDLIVYRFDQHLPRVSVHQYPYIWRGIQYLQALIPEIGIDKILFIDTDVYILTSEFAQYLKELDSGWTSMWCKKYGFAETSLHVLCKDSMDLFLNFPVPSWTHYDGKPLEELLPFTKILKDRFKGCRYGEGAEPQTPDMHYYAQHNVGNCPKMIFDMEKKDADKIGQ